MSDSSTILLIILGVILLSILFFTIFKGIIRMILLSVAIITAVCVWVFLQRNGFTYVAFLTDTPKPWMVQLLAWGVSVFILVAFFHGMVWISQLFTFRKKVSAGGIITTILMCLLMLWVGNIAISYYGDVCKIRYFHELALAETRGQVRPEMPWFTRAKETLRGQTYTQWLNSIDPMEDKAQTNLACLIAFGCSLDEPTYTAFYNQQLANRGIPQPGRFLDLFQDEGLRTHVKEGRFVTLLENERLKTFLQFRDTAIHMKTIL